MLALALIPAALLLAPTAAMAPWPLRAPTAAAAAALDLAAAAAALLAAADVAGVRSRSGALVAAGLAGAVLGCVAVLLTAMAS